MSSCGQHSWCCQSEANNAAYCCTENKKFNLVNVQENAFQIPLTASASSSSPTPDPTAKATPSGSLSASPEFTSPSSGSSSFHSKMEATAVGIGLGIPFGLAFIACLFFTLRKYHRQRRAPQEILFHKEADLDDGALKSPSGSMEMPGDKFAAEVPGYGKFELYGEKQMPVEISG